MGVPEKFKNLKKYTHDFHIRLNDLTVNRLFKAYESYYAKEYSTFSAYLRSVIEDYARSPYLARIIGRS